jgi:DNA primase
MALPPRFLEELRGRVSIIDVIGRRVRLIRKGRGEATGLCPFHNEKTPSFTVSEDKGFYHCFGCGAHGDVIGFVMQTEGLEFRDAVERLAAEAGMEVPRETAEDRARAERQATLGGAVEFAANWFEQQLGAFAGRAGLDYLRRRGLSDETIQRFRLGFAPDTRHGLKAALEKASIPEAIAIEAGLLIKPEDRGHSYDRFRGRVMFPILDRRGQVIAFGGRIIGDGEPKYLNSPETPLFHKGRNLYGLNLAQKSARDSNQIVVVEGYMDVISLAQAGFSNVVAPLGTALTEDQIEILWRLAEEPTLCFDGDAAGQRAAARAGERALPILKPGLSLKIALLPPGEDPDTLVKSQGGVEAFRTVLSEATPLHVLVWRMLMQGREITTPERWAKLKADIRQKTQIILDRQVREEYQKQLLQFVEDGVERPAAGRKPITGRKILTPSGIALAYRDWIFLPPHQQNLGGEAAIFGTESVLRWPYFCIVATLLYKPVLVDRHAEFVSGVQFTDPDLDRLRQAILGHVGRDPDIRPASLWSRLLQDDLKLVLDKVSKRANFELFARPNASLEAADRGLAEIIDRLRARELRNDLAIAARALAEDMTTENLERFEAIRDHIIENEGKQAIFEDADLPSTLTRSGSAAER